MHREETRKMEKRTVLRSASRRKAWVVFLLAVACMVAQFFSGVSPAHAIGGTPDETWMTNGTVFAQTLSEDKKTIYIGGNFSAVNGTPRSNIAEVDPADGSLKPFAPQITYEGNTLPPTVNTMLVDGSRLYVAGDFNRVGTQVRAKMAAFGLATGALDND